MIVCPVCENAQAAGTECEVCGRSLAELQPLDPGALLEITPEPPPVEGLEPTRHEVGAELAAAAPVPELEPTGHAAAPEVAPEPVPDLQATASAPVEAPEERLEDVERIGDGIPADAPTPFPALVTCRYCRTPAAPGERLCSRCGMRLPLAAPAAAPAAGAEARLCSCGAPVRGALCPACGARHADAPG